MDRFRLDSFEMIQQKVFRLTLYSKVNFKTIKPYYDISIFVMQRLQQGLMRSIRPLRKFKFIHGVYIDCLIITDFNKSPARTFPEYPVIELTNKFH